jgi:hypothetical protein
MKSLIKVQLVKDELADCFTCMDEVSCGSKLRNTYKDNNFKNLEKTTECKRLLDV